VAVALERSSRRQAGWVRSNSVRMAALLRRESLCVVAVCWFAAVLLILGPRLLTQDSWLTLVAGREIVQHGLPGADALASLTAGRDWVDQQWLAHVLYYGAARVGGLEGAFVLHVVALLAAAAVAMVAARRRGGSLRAVALVVPATLLIAPAGWDLRAQALAYLPFVLVLWVLVEHRRALSPWVLVVLPLLVVWSNLHGSVVLGAGLAVLYAATMLVRHRVARERWIAAVLALGAPATVLASPFGTSLVGYYHRILLDPPFAGLVLEWQRTTLVPATALFWLAGAVVVALVARRPSAFTLFEVAALAGLFGVGVHVVRNLVWFGLAAAVLVPQALDREIPALARRRASKGDAVMVSVALALAGCLAAVSLVGFDGRYRTLWPGGGAARASALAGPQGRVFASERLADWLLWQSPRLRGRIAYDARIELLSKREVERIVAFESGLPGSASVVAGYDVVALTRHDAAAVALLVRLRAFRIVYHDDRSIVLVRAPEPPPPQTAVQASRS
jgi:hypothetical protein